MSFIRSTLADVRVTLAAVHDRGLTVRRWLRSEQFEMAYGEILTAERRRGGRQLILHIRTAGDVRLIGLRGRARRVEDALRARGVRIVDCWGAIIAPSLADFEEELAREPLPVRQSSDDA